LHIAIFFFQLLFLEPKKNTEELRTHREIFVHLRVVSKGGRTKTGKQLGICVCLGAEGKGETNNIVPPEKNTRGFLHFLGVYCYNPCFSMFMVLGWFNGDLPWYKKSPKKTHSRYLYNIILVPETSPQN